MNNNLRIQLYGQWKKKMKFGCKDIKAFEYTDIKLKHN